jgi:hypothetical protein
MVRNTQQVTLLLSLAGSAACGGTTGRPAPSGATGALGDGGTDYQDGSSQTFDDGGDPPPQPDAWTLPCNGDWIVPDPTGFVASDSNASHITGRWYPHRDCDDFASLGAGTPLPGINCSQVSTPVPDMPFVPDPGTSHMCTSGSTVHVLSDAELTLKWGALIALDLNNPDGNKSDFDAIAAGLRGFCFYLSGTIVPAFQVRLPSDQGIPGTDWYQETLQHEGWHRVLFQDLRQEQPTVAAFDATKIISIEFQIPASRTEAVQWDFCIDGLVAIK